MRNLLNKLAHLIGATIFALMLVFERKRHG
jgi:hypothetical protein